MFSESQNVARQSLLRASAPDPVVEALLGQATICGFDEGATIFAKDDPADAIFIVISGWVKLFRISPPGAEAVVGVFTKGHSLGEAVALHGVRYPVFAGAVTKVSLMQIDARVFLDLLTQTSQVAIAMLTATYAHLHSLVAQIEKLKAQTGPQRVAEFLLDLSVAKVGLCAVKLPFDKTLIAGRLGMKPESVSRAFSKLRDRAEAWHKT